MNSKRVNKLLNKTIILLLIFVISLYAKKYVEESYSYQETGISTTSKLEIYYFDVGQADSIFINNNGYTMLIDAGNNSDGENIVNFLKEKNISDIDIVVGTHPHEDHIGGLDDVIKSFEIGKIYMPDAISTSNTFNDVLDIIEEKEYTVNIPIVDEVFNLHDMRFKVIHTGTDEKDLNDSSIVLRLDFGSTSYLFTGDISTSVEKDLLDKDIKVDVLKVAHHGSNYSSSDKFLNIINPKYAIISVGYNNKYDHPSNKILERLKNSNVYRTDKDGTIKIDSDGKSINVSKLDLSLDGN